MIKTPSRVIGIIQARMSSGRLPGKVLYPCPFGGALLFGLITRLKIVDIEWWVATSSDKSDDIIERYAIAAGVKCFRGSRVDVLSRFEAIQANRHADWIIRVTADNPLTAPELVEKLITDAHLAKSNVDLITDSYGDRTYPQGIFPSIVRAEALEKIRADINPGEEYHFSHVTSALKKISKTSCTNYGGPIHRLTIDTLEDYEVISKLLTELGPDWPSVTLAKLETKFKENNEYFSLNSKVKQKNISEG